MLFTMIQVPQKKPTLDPAVCAPQDNCNRFKDIVFPHSRMMMGVFLFTTISSWLYSLIVIQNHTPAHSMQKSMDGKAFLHTSVI